MKLARYHTRRDKFIAFTGCFHGRTFRSALVDGQQIGAAQRIWRVVRRRFPCALSQHVSRYHGDFRLRLWAAIVSSYIQNDLFKKLVDPEEVAAIFIEPIQGEGGYVPAPAAFLQKLQALCRKHGILLSADEVQSGMGRTGKWWAHEHAGIEPDIVCTAKGIASGMPLGAMIARASVMDWKPGAHATTFGGNPVCLAAGLATFDLLEREYIANAARMGDYLFVKMKDWPSRFRIVGDVRGKGLMIGVEFVHDQKTKAPAPDLRNSVIQAAFHHGLLILGAGENSIRIAPPLLIDEEQADFAVRTLETCISEAERSA